MRLIFLYLTASFLCFCSMFQEIRAVRGVVLCGSRLMGARIQVLLSLLLVICSGIKIGSIFIVNFIDLYLDCWGNCWAMSYIENYLFIYLILYKLHFSTKIYSSSYDLMTHYYSYIKMDLSFP